MNERIYDNQSLTAYLLGAAPEAEAERFDELSFTDDDFAGELSAAEKDLVDSYVRGELKGTNLEKFNSYYLSSPLRREKVEFARSFQTFAEKNAPAIAEHQTFQEVKQERRPNGFFANLFSFPAFQWSLAAATLAFIFFGGWLLLQNLRLRSETDEALARQSEFELRESELQNEIEKQRATGSEKEAELVRVREEMSRLEQTQQQERQRLAEIEAELKRALEQEQRQTPQTLAPKQSAAPSRPIIASFILAAPTRGTGQAQNLLIPEKAGTVAMRLELEPNDYAVYRVALVSQSGSRVIWRSATLKAKSAGENKTLGLNFPVRLLKSSQGYALEVSGVKPSSGETEIISNYPFRAVLK